MAKRKRMPPGCHREGSKVHCTKRGRKLLNKRKGK